MKALDFRVVLDWLPNPLCSHGRPPLLRSLLRERYLWPQKETIWSQLRRFDRHSIERERDPILDHQVQAPNPKKSTGTSCRATDGKTERSCRVGAAAEKQILRHGAKESIRGPKSGHYWFRKDLLTRLGDRCRWRGIAKYPAVFRKGVWARCRTPRSQPLSKNGGYSYPRKASARFAVRAAAREPVKP
jgi:hypothetical protein